MKNLNNPINKLNDHAFDKMSLKKRLMFIEILNYTCSIVKSTIHSHTRLVEAVQKYNIIKMATKSRLNQNQVTYLIDFMESHPEFANNQELGIQSKVTTTKIWQNLSDEINSRGPLTKTVLQLKESWRNFKKKVRDATQKININKRTTGNPPAVHELTEDELRIAELTGTQTVLGLNGVAPSGFGPVPHHNHDADKQLQTVTNNLSVFKEDVVNESEQSTILSSPPRPTNKNLQSTPSRATPKSRISSPCSSIRNRKFKPKDRKTYFKKSKRSSTEILTSISEKNLQQLMILNSHMGRLVEATEKIACSQQYNITNMPTTSYDFSNLSQIIESCPGSDEVVENPVEVSNSTKVIHPAESCVVDAAEIKIDKLDDYNNPGYSRNIKTLNISENEAQGDDSYSDQDVARFLKLIE